jgi:hypothetical protein
MKADGRLIADSDMEVPQDVDVIDDRDAAQMKDGVCLARG